MSDDPTKKRLGRGLAALIGELDAPANAKTGETAANTGKPGATSGGSGTAGLDTTRVPIERVVRNPANPRKVFAEEELTELAQSIRAHGIVQPVVVRPSRSVPGQFEIIAGERRWRAAQRAEQDTIPVVIRDVDDRLALELAIIENVQRADLNPVEEALGYQQLIDQYAYTQNDLAQVIAKSRSHVANTLRLLKLPDGVRDMISDGRLSAGHARTLVTADDPVALAQRIAREGLSVREAEALAQAAAHNTGNGAAADGSKRPREKDADTRALEKKLSDHLGLGVVITHQSRGGTITLRYKTLEQLDAICARLSRSD